MKNWFGLESHATDCFIHWSEKKHVAKAIKLRDAYDIISKSFPANLLILLAAAYDAGYSAGKDANNPDI